jgi:hypothetical protein
LSGYGICRVRILQGAGGNPPIPFLTGLNANTSTSLTSMVEVLTAELIAKHVRRRRSTSSGCFRRRPVGDRPVQTRRAGRRAVRSVLRKPSHP